MTPILTDLVKGLRDGLIIAAAFLYILDFFIRLAQ